MAIKTSAASGNWATGSTWVGGSAPIDGDEVVIAAGHSVLMNADLSAWTGLAGLTITSDAASPAMLYFKDGTSGYLKMASGAPIQGTDAALHGRLLANSDGVWGNTGALAFANKATIHLQGSAQILGAYLDIRLYCAQPVNPYVRTRGDFYSTVSSVDTTDNELAFASPHGQIENAFVMVTSTGTLPSPLEEDTIYFVRSGTTSYDMRLSLSITGETIDLTSTGSGTIKVYNGNEYYPLYTLNTLTDVSGDACWATATNHNKVAIVNTGASTTDYQTFTLSSKTATSLTFSDLTHPNQHPGARVFMLSRNVKIVQYTSYTTTVAINGAVDAVFQCEIDGAGIAFSACTNCTVSGVVYNFAKAMSGCTSCTVSGVVAICTEGVATSKKSTITGTITACGTAISGAVDGTVSGTLFGNTRCIGGNSGGISVTGTVHGAYQVMEHCDNCTFSGTIKHVVWDVGDFAWNCLYDSVKQLNYVTRQSLNSKTATGRLIANNYMGVANDNRVFDLHGDILLVPCNGTSDYPSVDPDGGNDTCIEATNVQSRVNFYVPLTVFNDHRVWCEAGPHTIAYKIQTTYSSIPSGALRLTAGFITSVSSLIATFQGEAATFQGDSVTIGGAGDYEEATIQGQPVTFDGETVYWQGQPVTGDFVYAETDAAPSLMVRSGKDDWTQIVQVSLTLGQAGWVDMRLELMTYESGKNLFVWPTPVVDGTPAGGDNVLFQGEQATWHGENLTW